jgi:hypothetical protein
LTAEFMNLADGKRTLTDIAKRVGYEYHVTIKPEHVMEFFKEAVIKGAAKFK